MKTQILCTLIAGCMLLGAPRARGAEAAGKKSLLLIESITGTDSKASLDKRFGLGNHKQSRMPVGEGECYPAGVYNEGTDAELRIVWADEQKTKIAIAQFVGRRWRFNSGIGIGTTLKNIEARNQGPFRLSGFGWDYAGTIMGYGAKGTLKGKMTGFTIRLSPSVQLPQVEKQVLGDKEYSSAHQAMQKFNPAVYEIKKTFTRITARSRQCDLIKIP